MQRWRDYTLSRCKAQPRSITRFPKSIPIATNNAVFSFGGEGTVAERAEFLDSADLSFGSQHGPSLSANRIKKLTSEEVEDPFTVGDVALAVKANVSVMRCREAEIKTLEQVVKERGKLKSAFRYLLSVSGIGQTLALTNMLETADIGRFSSVGNYTGPTTKEKKTGARYLKITEPPS